MEAPVLLGAEEADDLFEGTTEKGDVSSFEVCAAAVLKGKEAWENGVGIRSLISRAVASAAPCWSKVVRLPRLPRFVRCQLFELSIRCEHVEGDHSGLGHELWHSSPQPRARRARVCVTVCASPAPPVRSLSRSRDDALVAACCSTGAPEHAPEGRSRAYIIDGDT